MSSSFHGESSSPSPRRGLSSFSSSSFRGGSSLRGRVMFFTVRLLKKKILRNQRDKILYAYARTFEGMTRTQTSPSSANVITSGLRTNRVTSFDCHNSNEFTFKVRPHSRVSFNRTFASGSMDMCAHEKSSGVSCVGTGGDRKLHAETFPS